MTTKSNHSSQTDKTHADLAQQLVRCQKCGGLFPQKPYRNGNGFEEGPIVHSYWSIHKSIGPINTWCPGGGI